MHLIKTEGGTETHILKAEKKLRRYILKISKMFALVKPAVNFFSFKTILFFKILTRSNQMFNH